MIKPALIATIISLGTFALGCNNCGCTAAKGKSNDHSHAHDGSHTHTHSHDGSHAHSHSHETKKSHDHDILTTAEKAGSFQTLTAAIKAAGLSETLEGKGPFTVFAPTDDAFAKLPKGTVEELLKPENKEKLVSILTYHVVEGEVKAKDVVKRTKVTTVQGDDVAIQVANGKVMVGGATVIKADVKATNCVIRVIDTVMLPK